MPQIRLKDYNFERIGQGFNSQTGEAIGTALDVSDLTADKVAPGSVFESEIMIINSHDELQEQLGMEFEGEGRYGLFAASAKAKFAEKTEYNSNSTFVVAKSIVRNAMVRAGNTRLKPEAEAYIKSTPPRLDEFKTAYGDMFVRGLLTGGEFYCVIRITSISTVKQKELAVAAHAEFTNPLAGGSFSAKYSEANQQASTKSEYSAKMYQRGGVGQQGSAPVTIEEALQRYKAFAQIAYENPVGFVTELANYDTLPLPVPPIEEQENYLFALRDAREKKLYYIQKMNDFEFASKQPEFFENPPPIEELMAAAGTYRRLISEVMAYATRLTKGLMETPVLFTPSITEPTIKLKRLTTTVGMDIVQVPKVVDSSVRSAVIQLESMQLKPVRHPTFVNEGDNVRKDIVEKQEPQPNIPVKTGTEVHIYYNTVRPFQVNPFATQDLANQIQNIPIPHRPSYDVSEPAFHLAYRSMPYYYPSYIPFHPFINNTTTLRNYFSYPRMISATPFVHPYWFYYSYANYHHSHFYRNNYYPGMFGPFYTGIQLQNPYGMYNTSSPNQVFNSKKKTLDR